MLQKVRNEESHQKKRKFGEQSKLEKFFANKRNVAESHPSTNPSNIEINASLVSSEILQTTCTSVNIETPHASVTQSETYPTTEQPGHSQADSTHPCMSTPDTHQDKSKQSNTSQALT